ncbi:hypothetical protein HFZ78_22510 [Priestia megaterium]|uniref:Uncharacterized protein n=1 Tax=Priestia megaterium TaxID=1404 RepID=A0A6H1P6J2_PRIMG|nr:hypothetical protein [Priestia megaterium]QIZ09138.1 hypothetical protein HFZ78_22510 [Priestia megaterium]
MKVLTDKDISLLFTFAYDNEVKDSRLLNNTRLAEIAMELITEANRIYRDEYDAVTTKLDDLFSRGIHFQSNSEGPFILASFCIGFQKKMKWSDQELYNQFKRNESFL